MTRYSGNVVSIRNDVYEFPSDTSTVAITLPQAQRLTDQVRLNKASTTGAWPILDTTIPSTKFAFPPTSPAFYSGRYSTESGVAFGAGATWLPSPLQSKVDALETVALSSAQAIGRLEARLDALVSAVSDIALDEVTADALSPLVAQATIPQLAGQSLALAMNRLADEGASLEVGLREFVRSQLVATDGQVRAAAARAIAFGAPDLAEASINNALNGEQNRAVAAVMKGALRAIAS